MKKIMFMAVAALALSACDDATVASRNISKAADNFEIERTIRMMNTWTGETWMQIRGRCNIVAQTQQLEVTCLVGDGKVLKHFLGLVGHTSYTVEQTKPGKVSLYHYRRTFKPQAIVPDIDFRGDGQELFTTRDVSD